MYKYIETLLTDLGVTTRRKKAWFAHWFQPVIPRDYKGMGTEFLLKRKLDDSAWVAQQSNNV
jgi:hypothetical protein